MSLERAVREGPGQTAESLVEAAVGPDITGVARRLHLPCMIWSEDGEVLWVNDAWSAYTGLDLAGTRAAGPAHLHGDAITDVMHRWEAIRARGEPGQLSLPIRGADGFIRPFLAQVAPLNDASGEGRRWFGVNADITSVMNSVRQLERENADLHSRVNDVTAQLDKSEELRLRFWDVTPDLLSVIPLPDRKPILVNDGAWMRTLGYSKFELMQIRIRDLVHPDDHARSLGMSEGMAPGSRVADFENRMRHKNGGWVWLSWNIVRDNDTYYCVARDITEEKTSQARLSDTERSFRLMVKSVVDYSMFMLTPDGEVSTWNAGAERIKGYRSDEIVGRHISVFYTDADRSRGAPQQALSTAAATGHYESEGWRVRKDGSLFWANVVIDAIHDEAGKLIGFAKITRDFTERRKAEHALQETQQQLAQAQKMEAIGQLTGGVAHDFNNLLAVVAGGVKLLQRGQPRERAEAIFASMQQAVDRGARLTRQLLSIGRKQETANSVAIPAAILRGMRELLQRTLGEDTEIELSLPGEDWSARIDASQFELVILNLCVNARDAMETGGRLSISIENTSVEGAEIIRLKVRDTGPGMTPEVMAHAFEPFFTTKDVGKGSGLGLAQVYGFAKQAGGKAWLENKPSGGLAVYLELPRSNEPGSEPVAPESAPASPAPAVDGAGRRVLLVEDDNGLAAMMLSVLADAGFETRRVATGADALATMQRETFDIVFSDIVMPGGMDGVELCRKIRERYPEMPVVLATGYSARADLDPTEFQILQKPYDVDRLVEVLDRALAKSAKG